jgi:UDPglucose--hexose-1-phosphate uridylyltransferase
LTVPELRQDPATREWVVIATERARRPEDFSRKEEKEPLAEYDADCPFCAGNETMTPPEIWAERPEGGKTDGPGWTVRVVPNKFAALTLDSEMEWENADQFFRGMGGFGSHEVVVEGGIHNARLCSLPEEEVVEIVRAWRVRYLDLEKDKRFRLVTIFRNYGKEAGTSLEHPHSQILATPIVPLHIRQRLDEATRYYDNHGRCVFCEMIEREREAGSRVVADEDGFLVFAPFGARVPFETYIMPHTHRATFGEITETEMRKFARVLSRTLGCMNRRIGDPPYNLVLRTAPFADREEEFYHWHVKVVPRLTTAAGFELGTGVYINITVPEHTAAFLRGGVEEKDE